MPKPSEVKKNLANKKANSENTGVNDTSNVEVKTAAKPDLSAANPSQPSNKKDLSSAEKLDLYLKVLSSDELSKIPQDKILQMRQKLNPYGRTIAGSDRFLNFSITQISHEYWKKLITTSMIAYLNRMCDEWRVPNGVPVVSVYEYLEDKKLLDTPQVVIDKNNTSLMYDYEFNRKMMEKRMIVKEFLEEMFQFNPDEHVRSAHRPNYKDTTRTPLETMAARLAVDHQAKKDKALAEERAAYLRSVGVKTKKVKITGRTKSGKTRTIIKEVPVDMPPATPVAPTPREPLDPAKPKDPTAVSTVTNMIPPHDMFGRFKMYFQENYEELREAVLALYCEKPEFEFAINPYSWHETRDQAEAFKKQHADEVIAEVFTAESGKWNIVDCFKQQRESVKFYNKNTIILEEMVKQIERDERLGQDLMAKRVEKEKKKNIIETGPDSENFEKWRRENDDLSKMGAKYIGDMADDDIPDDAVQVDVWKLAKGGLEIAKDKFYSKAEAPSFVKETTDKIEAGINPFEGSAKAPELPARGDNV